MRILSRLLMFLLVPCTWAQTASIPPLDVPIPPLTAPLPAVVDPGWSVSCSIPKNGGTCKINMPQRTLLKAGQTTTAPGKASTAEATAPVTIPPRTLLFECTIAALPDGQPDLKQPLTCTAKAK